MINRNVLFFEESLHDELQSREARATKNVNRIPQDQFLISSDQEIVDHISVEYQIQPIVLQEEHRTMSQIEAPVDVSGDPSRAFFREHRGPHEIPGTRIDVDLPFSGPDWVFRYRPNSYFSVFPHGEVYAGNLRITISLPHDADPAKFQSLYEKELELIQKYVSNANDQIAAYNQRLSRVIEQAVSSRRERLSNHAGISELLNIPIATKSGAPSLTPVKIEVRRPPPLPVPPKTGLVPEPGIAENSFEHILQFIRHQGRTFETTPATYAVHDEEGLRDIVVAALNGHFEGEAVADVFRRKGKTDICIESDDRVAFVGECKIWSGPKGASDATDQLLRYLTWRDSKASLIFFNTRNKDFSQILKAMPQSLEGHPLFIQILPCDEKGEWRVQMRSEEDQGRRVLVHVFAFNLFHSAKAS